MKLQKLALGLASITLLSIPLVACNEMSDIFGDSQNTANYDYYRTLPRSGAQVTQGKQVHQQQRQAGSARVEPSTTVATPVKHVNKQAGSTSGPKVPNMAPSVVQ